MGGYIARASASEVDVKPLTLQEQVLVARVLGVAEESVGFGEDTVNNEGAWLEQIGSRPGWEWCAVSASWPWRRAHELLDLDPPAWAFRRPGVIEPGARALVHAMGKVGRLYKDPSESRPGDLVLWTRWVLVKGIPTRKAHVGLVEREDGGLVYTFEGNVGKVPAKYKRMTHDVAKEPHFETFASPWKV
jgi:hypothetical protein